jgi:L-threonylcarbamoyladenylate synthase
MSFVVSGKEGVKQAVARLHAGELVAFPTETVYGLGADALNPIAVKKIYETKGRPDWHPLIVHIESADFVETWVNNPPSYAKRITDAFWPGPLTLVLERRIEIPDAVTAGLDTVAIRVPANENAQLLLKAFGSGIAAPSANKFGRVSATSAQHVLEEFPDLDLLIIDGGPSEIGLESTIAQLFEEEIVILRPGKISIGELQEVSGIRTRFSTADATSIAPGMLPSHYSPNAQVIVVSRQDAVRIAEEEQGKDKRVLLLNSEESETDFAQYLYDRLRAADRNDIDVVVVVPPPATESGLSSAIRDRLNKAAAEND